MYQMAGLATGPPKQPLLQPSMYIHSAMEHVAIYSNSRISSVFSCTETNHLSWICIRKRTNGLSKFRDYSKDSPATYGRSLVYGDHEIPGVTYSNYLIDLVMKCMYEKPSLRPTAKTLWYLVRDGYKACHKELESERPNVPEESDESIEDDTEEENAKKSRKKKTEEPYPPLHPIFQQAQLAPEGFREPMPEWMDDFSQRFDNFTFPRTPRCPTPEYKGKAHLQPDLYLGDDLPFDDRTTYPASRPQVPPRYPDGFPIVDERPSINIPEQYGDHPGSITRNCDLLRYYDRLGHMWMGEEKYWKMLEAGLDPQTYSWGMRIPDPEMDVDVGPMSGSEADGDGEEDGDEDESEAVHQSPKATFRFVEDAGCPGGV
ncbi:65301beb-a5e7-4aa4-8256-7da0873ef46c [Sclerotinia trifoliorum]|uniref:65301beb-a5e7-4aa4-8256-7da0873ef46c n=1 Tax=Sclerotinia trifoliorum TaxID=28548 RepID=A0A8H2ZN66_9HELO|nr:65301beb-a5e7-4aa4-8256-7da0873ef46c [Sclerotinia trifoliorum]